MSESVYTKESGLAHTRRREKPQPLRRSLDDAYRSSSEDEADERDALNNNSQGDFVELGMQDATQKTRSRHASYAREKESNRGSRVASGVAPTLAKAKRSCWRRRKCLFIFLLFFLAIIAIIAVGGAFVWRHAPKDGQSPPWYPARMSPPFCYSQSS